MAGKTTIEAIQKKREQAKALLSAKLLDGLNSGMPIPFDDDYIPEKKRRLFARAGKRRLERQDL